MQKIRAVPRDFYFFNLRFGLKYWLTGIDYVRYLEYPLVLQNLEVAKDAAMLDIGTGCSIFPLLLAVRGCIVYITDIDDKALHEQLKILNRGGLSHLLNQGRIFVENQDVRKLTFPSNFFDRVTAISTIEHIREDGDTKAAQELARVLRPGGKAVITVPYSQKFCENESSPWVRYFERRYNDEAILERLIKPSGLLISKIQYFGEKGFLFSHYYWKIPLYLRIPVMPFLPIASNLFLSLIDDTDKGKAGGVCLTLEKALEVVH